ncbi:MAG: HPr family phosphocarrier protein [Desulfovibrio sp.]|jgi:phosphocarrier protein|nr:HPr family phosphocarrier protein [Desulfovibrio sp.]
MKDFAAASEVERVFTVREEIGLHARPAVRLAQAAQEFSAEISLGCGNQLVDAKSVLDILSLSAVKGAVLTLRARGADAGEAAERLGEIFADFGAEE